MTKKDIFNYLTEKFPNKHVVVKEELKRYETGTIKQVFNAYVDDYNNLLGSYGWTPEFSTLGKLWKHVKARIEL